MKGEAQQRTWYQILQCEGSIRDQSWTVYDRQNTTQFPDSEYNIAYIVNGVSRIASKSKKGAWCKTADIHPDRNSKGKQDRGNIQANPMFVHPQSRS